MLGDGEAIVSGTVKVRAHYFEDGNVQLQTTKVRTAESALQCGLERMYDNVSVKTAKAMRRVLPITHVKMNWNIHELSLNRSFSLSKNAQQER